jgi:hypothetical protein
MVSKNGIDGYTKGVAIFNVFFPENYCDCRHCTFAGTNPLLETRYCKLTDEYIEKNDLSKRGKHCPVRFEEV